MKLKYMADKKGFTLIELMIVVVIIGILAALAIPRFMTAATRSRQSEAGLNLKQIYTMQHSYRQAANTYGDNGVSVAANGGGSFPIIGAQIQVNNRYQYDLVATVNTFTATATANIDDDATIDTWTMDDAGTLTNTIDDATS